MKLTKTIVISLLTGTMVIGTIGCSSTQPTTINFNSDEPKVEQYEEDIILTQKIILQLKQQLHKRVKRLQQHQRLLQNQVVINQVINNKRILNQVIHNQIMNNKIQK